MGAARDLPIHRGRNVGRKYLLIQRFLLRTVSCPTTVVVIRPGSTDNQVHFCRETTKFPVDLTHAKEPVAKRHRRNDRYAPWREMQRIRGNPIFAGVLPAKAGNHKSPCNRCDLPPLLRRNGAPLSRHSIPCQTQIHSPIQALITSNRKCPLPQTNAGLLRSPARAGDANHHLCAAV